MPRLTGLGLLLLVALGCTEDTPPEKRARNLYPLSSQGRLVRGERDAPAVFVRLRPGGQLQVEDGKHWTDASLDDFGARLASKWRQEKADKSGFGGASKRFVSIEADPATPWLHLLWAMTIAVEQKFYKLELSDGKRRLLALLPVDRDPPLPPHATANTVLEVQIVAGAEKAAAWGGVSVMQPTSFVYRFHEKARRGSDKDAFPARTGPPEAADLASVPRWIEEVQGAEKDDDDSLVSGEIRAGNRVPFARILDVMECFLDHGLPAVNFHGTGRPDANVRKSRRLPYPTGN